MSEKMKIFQKIQYVTVGIAFASIVLPLILLIFIPLVLCGIPSIMITYLCSAIFLERKGFHMRALPV